MFKLFAVAALGAAALTAAPAAAVTYDAFASFTGVQGAGGFSYGTTDGTVFTPFAVNTNCYVAGALCLADLPFSVAAVSKSATAFTQGGIVVPNDRLVVVPVNTALSTYVAFTIGQSNDYTYSAEFNQQTTNPAVGDVTITEFYTPFGGATQLFPTGGVNQGQPDIFTGFSTFLNAGDVIGYIIDRNGDNTSDATGVSFVVSQVPEPASWALMIAGFGMVGVASRRRSALAA